MKGHTAILLRKVIRHLFGILRGFEEWVEFESNPQKAAVLESSAASAAADRQRS